MFVAEVTDELILGLDVLQAYDATVDLGRHVLRLSRGVTLDARNTAAIIPVISAGRRSDSGSL